MRAQYLKRRANEQLNITLHSCFWEAETQNVVLEPAFIPYALRPSKQSLSIPLPRLHVSATIILAMHLHPSLRRPLIQQRPRGRTAKLVDIKAWPSKPPILELMSDLSRRSPPNNRQHNHAATIASFGSGGKVLRGLRGRIEDQSELDQVLHDGEGAGSGTTVEADGCYFGFTGYCGDGVSIAVRGKVGLIHVVVFVGTPSWLYIPMVTKALLMLYQLSLEVRITHRGISVIV